LAADIQQIDNAAERASRLVRQLLAFGGSSYWQPKGARPKTAFVMSLTS